MKKRLFSVLGIMVLMLSIVLLPNSAYAAGKSKGMYLTSGNSGLRGIVSTMVGTGNPPAFTLSATNPDRYQVLFSAQIHPYNSCIHADVYHERFVGGGTSHYLQFVSWCGQYSYTVNIADSTFRNKYVRTNTWNDTGFAFTDENMDIRIYNTSGNTWVGQVYNYNTSSWDTLLTRSGTAIQTVAYIDFGEDGVENANGDYCPTLYPWGIAQIRGIQKYSNGSWATLASSDIQQYYQDPNMYCFTNNVWQLKTPNPWQFKIVPYGASY